MVSILSFLLNSALLGVGLAMDAFSVSIANGLAESQMKPPRMAAIAGVYAFFQFFMPMAGWFMVHTIATIFTAFQRFIPWIALLLLCYIGGSMLLEGIRALRCPAKETGDCPVGEVVLRPGTLLLQGIATSIDALSVGFTIASYGAGAAFLCSLIIAVVTFVICMIGLLFGKRLGERFSGRATILGGLILIGIGLEIFFTH